MDNSSPEYSPLELFYTDESMIASPVDPDWKQQSSRGPGFGRESRRTCLTLLFQGVCLLISLASAISPPGLSKLAWVSVFGLFIILTAESLILVSKRSQLGGPFIAGAHPSYNWVALCLVGMLSISVRYGMREVHTWSFGLGLMLTLYSKRPTHGRQLKIIEGLALVSLAGLLVRLLVTSNYTGLLYTLGVFGSATRCLLILVAVVGMGVVATGMRIRANRRIVMLTWGMLLVSMWVVVRRVDSDATQTMQALRSTSQRKADIVSAVHENALQPFCRKYLSGTQRYFVWEAQISQLATLNNDCVPYAKEIIEKHTKTLSMMVTVVFCLLCVLAWAKSNSEYVSVGNKGGLIIAGLMTTAAVVISLIPNTFSDAYTSLSRLSFETPQLIRPLTTDKLFMEDLMPASKISQLSIDVLIHNEQCVHKLVGSNCKLHAIDTTENADRCHLKIACKEPTEHISLVANFTTKQIDLSNYFMKRGQSKLTVQLQSARSLQRQNTVNIVNGLTGLPMLTVNVTIFERDTWKVARELAITNGEIGREVLGASNQVVLLSAEGTQPMYISRENYFYVSGDFLPLYPRLPYCHSIVTLDALDFTTHQLYLADPISGVFYELSPGKFISEAGFVSEQSFSDYGAKYTVFITDPNFRLQLLEMTRQSTDRKLAASSASEQAEPEPKNKPRSGVTGLVLTGLLPKGESSEDLQPWVKATEGKIWVPTVAQLSEASEDEVSKGKSSESASKPKGIDKEADFHANAIEPVLREEQKMKVVNVKGLDGAVWHIVKFSIWNFVIISNGETTPDQIISGERINFHRILQTDSTAEVLKEAWAVVTFEDGKYIILRNQFFEDIRRLPLTNYAFELPAVDFMSHNLYNADKTLSGNILSKLIVNIQESAETKGLFSWLEKAGVTQDVPLRFLNSVDGYTKVNITNFIFEDDYDTYRVCLFCLLDLAEKDSQMKELLRKDELLGKNISFAIGTEVFRKRIEAVFFAFRFKLQNHIFIEDNPSQETSMFLGTGADQPFFEIEQKELSFIVSAFRASKLQNNWLQQASWQTVKAGSARDPYLVLGENVYTIDLKTVKAFVRSPAQTYEPSLFGNVSNILAYDELWKSGVRPELGSLKRMLESKAVPDGLFLSSTQRVLSRTWPFLMLNQGDSYKKVYLNSELVVVGLGKEPLLHGSLRKVSQKSREFIIQNEIKLNYTPYPQLDGTYDLSPVPMTILEQQIRLTSDGITVLKEAKPELFVLREGRVEPKVAPGWRAVVYEGEIYGFNQGELAKVCEHNLFRNTDEENKIETVLNVTLNKVSTIKLDGETKLEGRCIGEYRYELSCKGTFSGKIIRLHKGRWSEHKYYGRCKGLLDKVGCQGKYEGSLKIGHDLLFLDSDPSANYDMVKINRLSWFTNNGMKNKNIEGSCRQALFLQRQLCQDASYKLVERAPNEPKTVLATCHGKLHLQTLACTEGYALERCFGTVNEPEIKCNGTFTKIVCGQGGDQNGCTNPTAAQTNTVCKGLWNGSSCLSAEFDLQFSDKITLSGQCIGNYDRGENCEGLFKGEAIRCLTDYTAGFACQNKSREKFSCQGVLNKTGCHGVYKNGFIENGSEKFSLIEAGGYRYKLTTPKESNTKFVEVIGVSLLTSEETDQKNKQKTRRIITCNKKLQVLDRVCEDASIIQEVSKEGSENEWVRMSCKGKYQLNENRCDNSEFVYQVCKGKYKSDSNTICSGHFISRQCGSGGKELVCAKPEENAEEYLICYGVWNGAKCDVRDSPMIIKIGAEKYYAGLCTGSQDGNKLCRGTFKSGRLLSCAEGVDPRKEGKEKCLEMLDQNECVGQVNSEGCVGSFKTKLLINSRPFLLESPECKFHGQIVQGKSTLTGQKVSATDDEHFKIVCERSFDLEKKECVQARSEYLDEYVEKSQPGTSLKRLVSCQGTYKPESGSCGSDTYIIKECKGRYTETSAFEMTCLGAYRYRGCKAGGIGLSCSGKGQLEAVDCLNKYWDGSVCLRGSQNSKPSLQAGAPSMVKDVEGKEWKMVHFVMANLTMIGGNIKKSVAQRSSLDSLVLKSAVVLPNGNLYSMKLPEHDLSPVHLAEGQLSELEFQDFELDELDMNQLNSDEQAKFIHLKIEELTIRQLTVHDFQTGHCNIERLIVNEKSQGQVAIENIIFKEALGEIVLKDVVLILPLIPKQAIQGKLNESGKSSALELNIPNVKDLYLPQMSLKFKTGGTIDHGNFLQFKNYKLTNVEMLKLNMETYILGSDTLKKLEQTTKPVSPK
jgi:hypothetical protein